VFKESDLAQCLNLEKFIKEEFRIVESISQSRLVIMTKRNLYSGIVRLIDHLEFIWKDEKGN